MMVYEHKTMISNLHPLLFQPHVIIVKQLCGAYPIKDSLVEHVVSTVMQNVK